MDPETKRLLEETKALVKDNHQMLRAIRRHQWYSFLSTIIVWAVVILAPFYLYQQYLQPLMDKFSSGAGGVTTSSILGLPSSADLQNLINSIQGK